MYNLQIGLPVNIRTVSMKNILSPYFQIINNSAIRLPEVCTELDT